MLTRIAPITLVLLLAACASSSPSTATYRPTPAQSAQASRDAVDTPDWMKQADYAHGGPIPPMEANRKINEQPCTQGITLDAGNLKCR